TVAMRRRRPTPPLLPYTTLFRSDRHDAHRLPERQKGLRRARRRACQPGPVGVEIPGRGKQRETADLARATLGERQRQQPAHAIRSEEHTSALQSREKLVCRLLLE